VISDFLILHDRRVMLEENDFPQFTNEIDRRGWGRLADPGTGYNERIVREFYANAWNPMGRHGRMVSLVRGKEIPFDRVTIGQFLGTPLPDPLEDCPYHRRSQDREGFDDREVARALCLPGRTYQENPHHKALRIMRRDMRTLGSTWGALILSNIIPLSHTSSLTMPRCYLLYCIIQGIDVEIGRVVSDQINRFAQADPPTGPVRKYLGFPGLITSLCASFGVQVNPKKNLPMPMTASFIARFCTTEDPHFGGDSDQDEPHQTGEVPPPGDVHAASPLHQYTPQRASSSHAPPPSQTSSMDPELRDLMMEQFLTLQTGQHTIIDRLESLTLRVGNVEQRVETLSHEVEEIRAHQQEHHSASTQHWDHMEAQNASLFRGQMTAHHYTHQYLQAPEHFHWPDSRSFYEQNYWPGDRPHSEGNAGGTRPPRWARQGESGPDYTSTSQFQSAMDVQPISEEEFQRARAEERARWRRSS